MKHNELVRHFLDTDCQDIVSARHYLRKLLDALEEVPSVSSGEAWGIWWRFNRSLVGGIHVVNEELCKKAVAQFAPVPSVSRDTFKTMLWEYAAFIRSGAEREAYDYDSAAQRAGIGVTQRTEGK